MRIGGIERRAHDVELGLQRAQRLDDRVGGLDRVGPLARIARVGRRAQHAHREPQDADLRRPDRALRRLGQDRRVGGVPGQHAGQRAVAGALLLDHGLQLDRRARRDAQAAQPAHGADDGRQPGLHVPGAAAVEPVAVAARRERRAAPQRHRLGADDVDVAVEDQRAAVGRAVRLPRRDHVRLAGDVPAEGRRAGMPSSASRLSGTSTGSRPRSAKARRMIAWPGASRPSSVGASTSSASRSTMAGCSAATAAMISPSTGPSLPPWSAVACRCPRAPGGHRIAVGMEAIEQPTAPYLDAVGAYAFRGTARYHVPGHKGGPGADPGLRKTIGVDALATDVPQDIHGIDLGPSPTPYERAEQLAAEAFGAARTFFLTNGATQGNHTLCLALAPLGTRIVAQRNSHASVVDGLVLSGGHAELRRARVRRGARDHALRDAGRARRGAAPTRPTRGRRSSSRRRTTAWPPTSPRGGGRARRGRPARRRPGLGPALRLQRGAAADRARRRAPTRCSPARTRSPAR